MVTLHRPDLPDGAVFANRLSAEDASPMLSSESLPRPVARVAAISQRFQKFLLVGAFGLGVNQGLLYALVDWVGWPVAIASPFAILASMVVTFVLNERWTWHDRSGRPLLHRAMLYGSINSGGLVINWLMLVSLHNMGLNYLLANLLGAGVAAIWNFSLNHVITWRN
jgi:dolichol-phosphate mannosyltransferase